MNTKTTTITALAILYAYAGLPQSASAQEVNDLVQQCEFYETELFNDPVALQQALEELIEEDEFNPCIDFILARLGGTPIAQLPPY